MLDPLQRETPYEVEAPDRVRIQQAAVRDASYRDQLSGTISEETRNILQNQQVFLVADGPSVQLLAQR